MLINTEIPYQYNSLIIISFSFVNRVTFGYRMIGGRALSYPECITVDYNYQLLICHIPMYFGDNTVSYRLLSYSMEWAPCIYNKGIYASAPIGLRHTVPAASSWFPRVIHVKIYREILFVCIYAIKVSYKVLTTTVRVSLIRYRPQKLYAR